MISNDIMNVRTEMELGLCMTGHWVSDFGWVGSGHGSVCQSVRPSFWPGFEF